jgi:hypothetical protein
VIGSAMAISIRCAASLNGKPVNFMTRSMPSPPPQYRQFQVPSPLVSKNRQRSRPS